MKNGKNMPHTPRPINSAHLKEEEQALCLKYQRLKFRREWLSSEIQKNTIMIQQLSAALLNNNITR